MQSQFGIVRKSLATAGPRTRNTGLRAGIDMTGEMRAKGGRSDESLFAVGASKLAITGMDFLVIAQIGIKRERFATVATRKRSISVMETHVFLEVRSLLETVLAYLQQ